MRESRILAVNHVELYAHTGCEEELLWFYTGLVGLEVIDEPLQTPPRLRFRSAEIELRYGLVTRPRIERVAHRATLLVDSLPKARALLDEAGTPYVAITGTAFTDRWLSLLDPGGNRVAIRQAWRQIT